MHKFLKSFMNIHMVQYLRDIWRVEEDYDLTWFGQIIVILLKTIASIFMVIIEYFWVIIEYFLKGMIALIVAIIAMFVYTMIKIIVKNSDTKIFKDSISVFIDVFDFMVSNKPYYWTGRDKYAKDN